MKVSMRLLLILLPISLMGCASMKPSFVQNRDSHYLTATSIPPLRIPPGVTTKDFQNYYPVSDRDYSDSNKAVTIVPPGLYTATNAR